MLKVYLSSDLLGLVLDIIKENSSEYVTLLGGNNNNVEEDSPEDLGPISTKHLLAWAYQIAKGMEYLGSKKVFGAFSLRSCDKTAA